METVGADNLPGDSVADAVTVAPGFERGVNRVRDVKPSNVLIDRTGGVKLADFGIAKRLDDLAASLTMVGSVVGTPFYLAPEQAAGRTATPQSDVYSTGLVIYEMLTGSRPADESPDAVVGTDVRTLRPEASAWLASVVSQALAARPTDRFATAADMAAALRNRLPATAVSFVQATQLSERTAVVEPSAQPTSKVATQLAQVPPKRRRQWWLPVAAALIVVIAVIWFAGLESSRRDTVAAPTIASTSRVAATEPPNTATQPTPTTLPPPIQTGGAPVTAGATQLIEQLRAGREVAGKQSKRLADSLEKLLAMDSAQQEGSAEKLATQLDGWVAKEDIDPVVAESVYQLLRDLGARPRP